MFGGGCLDNDRGQSGIGALIDFVAMVLIAAMVSGMMINVAGLLQTQAEATSEEAVQEVTNRLEVQSVIGDTTAASQPSGADPKITTLNLTIRKAPGADAIDMSDVTISIIANGVHANLVHDDDLEIGDGVADWEGSFRTEAITDSNPDVIVDRSDRIKLTIGLSAVGDSGSTAELQAYDTVRIEMTTASGGQTSLETKAPNGIVGGHVYKL